MAERKEREKASSSSTSSMPVKTYRQKTSKDDEAADAAVSASKLAQYNLAFRFSMPSLRFL